MNPTNRRLMADPTQPAALFLVGMHVHSWFRVQDWFPVFWAMGKMLRELAADRSLGLVSSQATRSGRTFTVVQYWQSFAHLERYARADELVHRPAWLAFYRRAKNAGTTVGIFHETYVVTPGSLETLYVNMPTGFGVSGVTGAVPVGGRQEGARERLAPDGFGQPLERSGPTLVPTTE